TEVGTNDVLKNCLVGRAGRGPAGDAGIDEDDVQLAEILGKIREESLPVARHGHVGAIAARVGSQLGDSFIQRLLVPSGNRDSSAFGNEQAARGKPDAAVSAGDERLLAGEFHDSTLMTG